MKSWIAACLGLMIAGEVHAYSCSGGTGFDGSGTPTSGNAYINRSVLTSSGTGLWISGWDSDWGLTQIITDDNYKPPIEVLLGCLDAARRAQASNSQFRLVINGTFTLIPNAWGAGSCIMKITANLTCQLENR